MTEDTIQIPTAMRRKRRLKVAYNKSQSESGRHVAAVRFSGTYLEDLGFRVGEFMDLEVNDDLSITIRPVTPEQKAQDDAARTAVQKTND